MIESKAHPKLGLRGRQVDPAGNANYLLDDVRPDLPAVARGLNPRAVDIARRMARGDERIVDALTTETARRERRWREYLNAEKRDQGPTPRCTAFGSLAALHCMNLPHRPYPKVSGETYYRMNVANDLRRGLDFRASGGGATTQAACETAVQLGFAGSYWWTYDAGTALDALVADTAILNGTEWFESMFWPDAEGIVRVGANPQSAGGHLWCARGYVPRRDLVIVPQTWGRLQPAGQPLPPDLLPGEMLIPGEDYRRLIEDYAGEVFVLRELPDDRFVPPPPEYVAA